MYFIQKVTSEIESFLFDEMAAQISQNLSYFLIYIRVFITQSLRSEQKPINLMNFIWKSGHFFRRFHLPLTNVW